MKQVYPISIEGGMSRTGSYILMLEEPESGRRIPIVIGEHEANSILIAKGMVPTMRPTTHRLAVSIMEQYGISVTGASIDRMADGIFYATIHTTDGFNSKDIDSRTTDAVTIALLCGAPITVADSVLDECSTPASPSKPVAEVVTVESLERELRRWLDLVLGVRPRFKEFVLGNPILLCIPTLVMCRAGGRGCASSV